MLAILGGVRGFPRAAIKIDCNYFLMPGTGRMFYVKGINQHAELLDTARPEMRP